MPDRAEKHDGPLVLEVERFEHVVTGAERVLLRVDGRYGDRPGKRVLDAMLYVDDGLAVHRHAPVEDAGADVDSWLWRAAFDVPASYLTDERTRFAIESEPGRLLDLPRPRGLDRSPAVPVTARAAHLARRYAVAVAVMLAVAVTPGGLPASARTELLRVHNPDGSVSYITRDGRQVAQVPSDAVVVDETPARQPNDTAPQPAAPAADKPKHDSAETAPAKHHAGGSKDRPAAKHEPARHHDHARAHHAKKHPHHRSTRAAGEAQAAPSAASEHRAHHRHHHHSRGHDAAPALEGVTGEALAPMPELLARPGSDDARLAPLARVGQSGGAVRGGDDHYGPGKDVESLGNPPHGVHVDPPTELPDGSAPELFTLVPDNDSATGRDEPPTSGDEPTTTGGDEQHPAGDRHRAQRDHRRHGHGHRHEHKVHRRHEHTGGVRPRSAPSPSHESAGGGVAPTASGTSFFDSLPGPGHVPDFVIEKFRIPPFLLPIYQAAGIQYGIRWEVLAAINEIETDYGRNLNVSSAGALGWMQFMPSTWKMYGTDGNRDGQRDPYNPVDAIFAAARYLKAAGGDRDVRRAIFAYNHAGWYVDSVMLRAKLIAGYPEDVVGSLTGLTEGRFPVAARARYPEDAHAGGRRRGIDVYTRAGAPVVAVNDGVVRKIGRSKDKGLYVVLQDVYGNEYTYSELGSVAKAYPVPKRSPKASRGAEVEAVGAKDPRPTAPASAGSQSAAKPAVRHRHRLNRGHVAHAAGHAPVVAVRQRLFAHPSRPNARRNGGAEQLIDVQPSRGFETYDSYFARPLGLNSRNATLRPLRKGAHVVASTILGRVADTRAKGGKDASHLRFQIRPAGKGAPNVDPKPILDGWKLLESTAIYRASGRNALYGDGEFSVGQMMLLPKALLAKRILSDPRIKIYPAGRQDIKTGEIDRRVLIVLGYLAESGLHPTVSCLKSGHSFLTSSGNVSEHSSGNAVDISAINGVPIYGHQGHGDVTEQAVRRLMMLQGTVEPHQIISLLDFGRNTLALPDHDDHIHVGFHPRFGDNRGLGREAQSVLAPGQWGTLVERLGQIQNPTVPTRPSRYAIPDRKRRR